MIINKLLSLEEGNVNVTGVMSCGLCNPQACTHRSFAGVNLSAPPFPEIPPATPIPIPVDPSDPGITMRVEGPTYVNQDLRTTSSPTYVTTKLTGLSNGYVPKHTSDSAGLQNSPIWTDGTNVGISTASPAAKLAVNGGLHVGGDSDPDDNNLLVDGTCHIVGQSTLTGLVKTGAGLHVGGTSDPGPKNLLVDGTCHIVKTLEVTESSTLTGLVKTGAGLHVGGTSDPGPKNLLVDGTCEITESCKVGTTLEVTGVSTLTGFVKTGAGLHVGGTSNPGTGNLLVSGKATITGEFGCNSMAAQNSYDSGGELPEYNGAREQNVYGYSSAEQCEKIHELLTKIREALVANGIMS